jgi:hypothetical protein
MNVRFLGSALIASLGLLALGCSDGTSAPDTRNTPTAGAAGSNAGVSGSPGVGGAAGTGGTAGSTGAAGTGGAGTTGGTSGTAGAAGGSSVAGSAGAAGSGPVGVYDVPRGNSAGCGQPIPAGDSPDDFNKHDIAVTGVDPQFIQDHPSDPGNNGGYTYLMRNYFVQLPANYDPSIPYALTFGGGGCGNTSGDSGQGGGQQASGIDAIQVGLSYVYSGGACFEDGYANTPEVPYFDAVMADISAKYCVNLEKVFIGGYSSGAWEAVTLGLARGGVIRGIATGAGGLREERPMPSGIPMAAILLTGEGDGTNPIDGPTGSALARDEILLTNGCVGDATEPFTDSDQDCVKYTGCPAPFPVVWCTPGGGHTGGSDTHWAAVGKFWDTLPPVP